MQSKLLRLGKFEIRFNWIVALGVVFAIGGLLRLGVWQLDRASERREIIERQEVEEINNPIPLASIMSNTSGNAFANMDGHFVSLQGVYLNDKTFFVVYQQFEEQLGYEVITPFRLTDNGAVVLVSRGWISLAIYEDHSLLSRIEGDQNLLGRIHISDQDSVPRNDLTKIEWPLTIRHVNVVELGGWLGRPVFPHVVRLAENQPGVLVRHWQSNLPDWSTNISYAVQWFAMAFAVFVICLLMSSNVITLINNKMDEL